MGQPFKDTLTFEEAVRHSYGPAAFNLMIKPAGSLCNMDCSYCYYLDKAAIYGGRQPLMSEELLEHLTKEYIAANDVPHVTFNWHGGEPLVAGLDFYRKAVAFQKKYADGKVIHNTLQTNGTLVSREAADFFRENDFLIGISIDGPEDIHDRYRVDKGHLPTFDRVMRGLEHLRISGVEFNTMTTVSKASEGRGKDVYRFLKSVGSRYMQFMPVVQPVENAVSSEGFGEFMCDVFDDWVQNDVGQYFVSLFDATLANYCGQQPGICAYASTCGGNTVVEHNGDVYPCDHFVFPEYFMGNVREIPLRQLASSDLQHKFGLDKRNTLPSRCCVCKYVHLCHGECPKNRLCTTNDGDAGLSSLCEGYYMFFEHTAPYMLKMRELLRA